MISACPRIGEFDHHPAKALFSIREGLNPFAGERFLSGSEAPGPCLAQQSLSGLAPWAS